MEHTTQNINNLVILATTVNLIGLLKGFREFVKCINNTSVFLSFSNNIHYLKYWGKIERACNGKSGVFCSLSSLWLGITKQELCSVKARRKLFVIKLLVVFIRSEEEVVVWLLSCVSVSLARTGRVRWGLICSQWGWPGQVVETAGLAAILTNHHCGDWLQGETGGTNVFLLAGPVSVVV